MDLPSTVTVTIGYLAATAIPAYLQVSNFCKGDRLRHPDVLADCRELAAVLRRGDTYITEMLGIAIARRVWPEESKEYQDAVAATRIAHYRVEVESEWNARHLKRADDYQNYLAILASHGREQDVFLSEIVNAGLNPNPTSDWQDPLLTHR